MRFLAALLLCCLAISLVCRAADAPTPEPIPGYSVITSTDFGKSLYCQKPAAASVTAALQSALPDLGHYFDGKPALKGAYEDSKSHQSGGAVFAAMLKGQAVKGVLSCKLTDKSAAVTVVYCRADAPQSEWSKLTTAPAAPAAGATSAGPPPAADPATKLGDNAQVYQFPDGTGSLMLAEGWKTQAPSAISPILIQGPADQNIFINSGRSIMTPDSPMVKTRQRNQSSMRQMNRNATPPPFMFVAAFTDPVQSMKDLNSQLSQYSQSHGGPAIQLDEIISSQDVPSSLKDGKAAVINWSVTRTLNGVAKHYRGIQKLQMAQSNPNSWTMIATGFTGPVDTFDHDRPLMFAMTQCVKVNADAASQKIQQMSEQEMAAIKQQGAAIAAAAQASHDQYMRDQAQRFADGQERLAETKEGYDAHNQQFQADELQKARNKDDYVEHILGYRTVYDTQTGLSTTADLSDVTGVVNSLNQAALDPNRFVQIPLRDEQDPGPGR
jgi:hypothetical protein